MLIDRAHHLINNKANSNIVSRVVVAIDLPNLWLSQIIVFFEDDYYKNFFKRNTEYQRWILLSENRNIEREWGLSIPENMKVKGYSEKVIDEDYTYNGELWFIGEFELEETI